MTQIPPITNPLGKHWKQPPLDEVILEDGIAMMPPKAFDQLSDYSASIPSGTYAGKMWKSKFADGWFLRWYEDDPTDKDSLLIKSLPIIIIGRYCLSPDGSSLISQES